MHPARGWLLAWARGFKLVRPAAGCESGASAGRGWLVTRGGCVCGCVVEWVAACRCRWGGRRAPGERWGSQPGREALLALLLLRQTLVVLLCHCE